MIFSVLSLSLPFPQPYLLRNGVDGPLSENYIVEEVYFLKESVFVHCFSSLSTLRHSKFLYNIGGKYCSLLLIVLHLSCIILQLLQYTGQDFFHGLVERNRANISFNVNNIAFGFGWVSALVVNFA